MKSSNYSLVPVFSLKIQFYSYLVENSQKATLNFYFKSIFFVKPSKFSIRDELRDLVSVTIWRLHGSSSVCRCMLTLFSTFMSFLSICMSFHIIQMGLSNFSNLVKLISTTGSNKTKL